MARPRLYHEAVGSVLESIDGIPVRFVLLLAGPTRSTSWLCTARGAGGYRVRWLRKGQIDRITKRRHWRAARDRVSVLASVIARQLLLPFEPMPSASGGDTCTNETGPQSPRNYGSQT